MDYRQRFTEACERGSYYDVVECVEKYGINPNVDYYRGLRHVLEKGFLYIAKYLFEHGVTLAPEHISAACYSGNLELVKFLISRGANIHAEIDGNTDRPISCALARHHLHIVRFLLENGATIGNLTLNTTKQLLSVDLTLPIGMYMINLLRNKGISYQDIIDKALLAACRNGHPESVKYLLSIGANIDTQFIVPCPGEEHLNGLTPIAFASKYRWGVCPKELIVKLLLDYGANPDELDLENSTREMKEYIPINPRRVQCVL